MRKLVFFCSIIGAPFAVAGCTSGPSTGTSQGAVMSCFDGSKAGLTCVDTPDGPDTRSMDVDDDGQDDPFVCADRDHDDDGTPDFEDAHHDRGGGGGSGSGSASGSSADGSHDGSDDAARPDDQDGDGIDDAHDCGTTPPQPPV